jgi:hypothetical protein
MNGGGKKKSSSKSSGSFFDINNAIKNIQGLVAPNGLLTAGPSPTSLAEAIERQAAGQDAQVQQNPTGTGTDPFTALQNQLFNAANSISVAATPLEQLRKLAEQQVAAQYDPQISAVSNEIKTHVKRGKRSEQTARDMYGSLAKDYLAQLPDITAQYKAQDDEANQRYDQAQQQMQNEYQQNAQQQDAVLKQLGVQAAAPDASQQSKDDQAYFQNQSNLDQQNALNALAQQQMAETDYARNLGNSSRMAGENTAQSIDQQLSDYLDQAGGQLDSLTAGKSQAIAALLQQLQMQDQQRVQQQGQQQFDNMMKLYNFQLQAQNDAAKANHLQGSGFGGSGGGGLSGLTTGLPGASNYLASQFPNQPIHANQLMDLIQNVLSDKTVKQGKFILQPGDPSLGKDPKYSDVGQQYMEGLLRKELMNSPYANNPLDINAALAALEAYLGKVR